MGGDYSFTLFRLAENRKMPLAPAREADDFCVRSATLLAGERAALASDWGLGLHDTRTGKELFLYASAPDSSELAPSPDGRFFAAGGQTVEVYPTAGRDRLLSVYVAGDHWVVWGPGGYYAASWHGDLPVGHFVDSGPEQLAEFVPLNRVKGRHRPDVVRRLLTAGSLEQALRELGPPRR
jgi:hypothetical protein